MQYPHKLSGSWAAPPIGANVKGGSLSHRFALRRLDMEYLVFQRSFDIRIDSFPTAENDLYDLKVERKHRVQFSVEPR